MFVGYSLKGLITIRSDWLGFVRLERGVQLQFQRRESAYHDVMGFVG